MRHELTFTIALRSMAAFTLLAFVSVFISEQGILAAPSLLGTAPTPDAIFSGGGVPTAGFYALAVAGILGTLAAAPFSGGLPSGRMVARIGGQGGVR